MALTEQQKDEADDQLYYHYCLKEMQDFLRDNSTSLEGYMAVCERDGYIPDYMGYGVVSDLRKQLESICKRFEVILNQEAKTLAAYTQRINNMNQLYRAAVQLRVPASRVLSWCSTAYGQSTDTMFFHPQTLEGEGSEFNYDRSRSYHTPRLENSLMDTLGLHPDQCSLLSTSSGMAAYTLLENYLCQDVLVDGDMIYSPRQNYGETHHVMFRNTKFNKVQHADDTEGQIIEFIRMHHPKVILLSSMYNVLGTPLLNVMGILKSLSEANLQNDIHILIDDSLMTGAINPFLYQTNHIYIYYFSSGIKYLQMGMDSGYMGVLAIKNSQHEYLRKLRGLLGVGLYDSAAWLYPIISRDVFMGRMKRLSRNALLTAKILSEDKNIQDHIAVHYPMMAGHPDHEIANTFPFMGSIVTLHFKHGPQFADLSNVQPLFKLIRKIIGKAHEEGISITHSESFGFSNFRINAYGWHGELPPYIRLSCGDRSYEETILVANKLLAGLTEHITKGDL